MRGLCAAALGAALLATHAGAVSLNGDGLGQALIFPYYTVQSAGGNAWNTYLSIVNHESTAKVLRVRAREGRNGREVASFNLYLGGHDMWTGAIIPGADEAAAPRLLSIDGSCTNPPLVLPSGLVFRNDDYTGSRDDMMGSGLDRAREGYVEVIEMATLTGAAAATVESLSGDYPGTCPGLQGAGVTLAGQVQAPTGGVSGTLTLINVTNGMDAAVNATALANLTTLPFYRNHEDPYPDFNAAEVIPVALVVTREANSTAILSRDKSYRLVWSNGADAVSAALMSLWAVNEFVLEPTTQSQTDWVLTYPTRRLYATDAGPFRQMGPGNFNNYFFDRAERGASSPGGLRPCTFFFEPCDPVPIKSATVMPIHNHGNSPVSLLGSQNTIVEESETPTYFTAGWRRVNHNYSSFVDTAFGFMTSLPTSSSIDHVTGASETGAFRINGLPVVGLAIRTFSNGQLLCSNGVCQGNYGGAFPMRYLRWITSLP